MLLHYFTTETGNSVLFPFLTMTGPFTPAVEQMEDTSFPGVDGKGYWLTGRRGSPFSLQTMVDYPTTATANGIRQQYESWAGKFVRVFYAGQQWELVIVRNVSIQKLQTVHSVKGGLHVPPGAGGVLLYATWTVEAQPK